MAALISLFAVVLVSLLITRISSAVFRFTGMSPESARFQARSAFSGTGYTTDEAEGVVEHPVRRRLVLALMLLGNAGLVSVITTLVWSFVGTESGGEALLRGVVLVAGLGVLAGVAGSGWIDERLRGVVEWALRRFTDLEEGYARLVEVEGDYTVGRVEVEADSWLANRRLDELAIDREGVLLLGLKRSDGSFVGSPRGRYTLRPGETLVLYGPDARLGELRERLRGAEGDREARSARDEHADKMREQDRKQREYAERRG